MKKQDIDFTLIPDEPGVYFFWDTPRPLPTSPSFGEEPLRNADAFGLVPLSETRRGVRGEGGGRVGSILYIGKATSLRNRVKSYFDKDLIESRGLKLVNMVLAAKRVTYEVTNNVMEALLLENVLIKKHQPYYNSKEKDNKSYTCVIITDEDFPRVLTMRVREYEKRLGIDKSFRKAHVYGPFTSAKDIRETLKIIRKIFPYRDRCEPHTLPSSPIFGGEPLRNADASGVVPLSETRRGVRGEGGGCFNFQLGLCPGVCIGKINKADYAKNIRSIKYLFEGKSKSLMEVLNKEMNVYAKAHKFELAATRRDAIYRLSHISDVALINNDDINEWKDNDFRIECYDVAHISGSERVGVMTVIEGGKKKTDEYRKFKLEKDINDDYAGIRELITRRMSHKEWRMPDLIVYDGGIGQKNAGDNTLISLGINNVHTVAVVKDDRHKAKGIIGQYFESINNKTEKDKLERAIYLGNVEAHRFSIKWHRERRDIIKVKL